MNITLIATAAVLAFLASCIAVEVIRAKTLDARTSPISAYLTGPYGWVEDMGFLALALGLWIFPAIGMGALLLKIGAIGVAGSMISRRFGPSVISNASLVTRIHIIFSGIAFGATALGLGVLGNIPVKAILMGTVLLDVSLYFDKSVATWRNEFIEKLSALGICLAALTALWT